MAAVLLFVAGGGSLAFALIMQWGFNVPPCDLCYWQRAPYGVVAFLASLALVWRPYRRKTTLLLGLCSLVFLVSTGLAILHTGVERHWWESPTTCTAESLQGASIEEMRLALLETESPPCDEIPWAIFGLSMANLNIAASLVLAFFAAMAAIKHKKKIKL